MHTTKGLLSFLLLILLSAVVCSQDNKQVFLEAESYFHFEEYNEALPSYLRLIKEFPDNANLNYKTGICYLNIPYEKEKSIEYLEKAKSNITEKYKDNSFKEEAAPPDVYFYLGNAYRVNNKLEKALENYYKFKDILDPSVYKEELVDEQITAVLNAKKLKADPVDIDITNLGEKINTRFAQRNPVISADGNKLIYVEKLQFYDAVFFAEKKNGEWQYPRNLIPEFGVDGDAYPTSLSHDGTELYLYRNEGFLGEIYVSHYRNGTWSSLKKLGENINTKYWESHACIAPDGKTLYFTSNRKGGYGDLDIYKSFRNEDGTWGPAVNLGPTINTAYNEETPFITDDGKTLYFSSYGHFNMGGYDVFYSGLFDDGTWSVPLNAGYPINTTDDDIFFKPYKNGTFAYVSRFEPENTFGQNDIYLITIYSGTNPRKFIINGIVRLEGKVGPVPSTVKIQVFEKGSLSSLFESRVRPVTDTFTLNLPAGKYTLKINEEGFDEILEEFEITKNYKPGDFSLEPLLVESPEPGDFPTDELIPEITTPSLSFDKNEIEAKEGETVKIRIKTADADQAIFNLLNDSLLVKTDIYELDKNRFTYKFKPEPGNNMLEIILRNKSGGETRDTIWIKTTRSKEDLPAVEPVSETEPQQPSGQVVLSASEKNRLRNLLFESATGNLKAYLDSVNLDQVISTRDMANKLVADTTRGYAMNDVEQLFEQYASKLEVNGFKDMLAAHAEGNLKSKLDTMDAGKHGLETPDELIQHLYSLAGDEAFSPSDILKALAKMGSTGDVGQFILDLTKYTGDDLDEILLNISNNNNIQNTDALIDLMITKHPDKESELITALTGLAREAYLNSLIDKMIEMSSGELKALLTYLKNNLKKENITSFADIVDYLFDHARSAGIAREDIIDLLIRVTSQMHDIAGNKKVTTSETDLSKEKKGDIPVIGLVLIPILVGLFIFLFILFRKRRKNKAE